MAQSVFGYFLLMFRIDIILIYLLLAIEKDLYFVISISDLWNKSFKKQVSTLHHDNFKYYVSSKGFIIWCVVLTIFFSHALMRKKTSCDDWATTHSRFNAQKDWRATKNQWKQQFTCLVLRQFAIGNDRMKTLQKEMSAYQDGKKWPKLFFQRYPNSVINQWTFTGTQRGKQAKALTSTFNFNDEKDINYCKQKRRKNWLRSKKRRANFFTRQ